jgi:hypothetical protein
VSKQRFPIECLMDEFVVVGAGLDFVIASYIHSLSMAVGATPHLLPICFLLSVLAMAVAVVRRGLTSIGSPLLAGNGVAL